MKRRNSRKTVALVLLMLFTLLFAACKKQPIDVIEEDISGLTKAPTNKPTRPPVAFIEENDDGAVLVKASSYEEVQNALNAVATQRTRFGMNRIEIDNVFSNEKTASGASADTSSNPTDYVPSANSKNIGGAFSKTNNQVSGVDEADIIKNDGHFLYVYNANDNEIYIVKTDAGKLSLTATISIPMSEYGNGKEMYLLDNRLVLITENYEANPIADENTAELLTGKMQLDDSYFLGYNKNVTYLLTYDISNRETPEFLSALKQDGQLISSRCAESRIYLFTSFYQGYSLLNNLSKNGKDTLEAGTQTTYSIPEVNGEKMRPEQMYICKEPYSSSLLLLSAMSPENPENFTDNKSLIASGNHCYVSENYIYIGCERWPSQQFPYERTEVYRFRYENGTITTAGQMTVKGTLNNQFSMDEYNGNLRIVTTVEEYEYDYERLKNELTDVNRDGVINNDDLDIAFQMFYVSEAKESNALYIYDDSLTKIGQIEDIAKNEHIESARLMGDTGYFVTFRRTDPLFSVDLSDPRNPKILGALKIPGFSEYLHPYGDGLLLGIGYDADETTGFRNCLKLSMFDISDPSNVKELHKLLLSDYYNSEASENHKAVLIDVTKNLIGFPARGDIDSKEQNAYLLFSFSRENGFCQRPLDANGVQWREDAFDYFRSASMRGAFTEDILYVIKPDLEIRSFHLDSCEPLESLLFRPVDPEIQQEDNRLVVSLEANFTTGYSWEVTVIGDAITYDGSEVSEAENPDGLVGAPLTETFFFSPAAPGTARISFLYKRAWETNAIQEIVYDVVVDEQQNIIVLNKEVFE